MFSALIDLDLERHFSALGKLDCVADQIDDHLTQTRRIANDANRHIRPHIGNQLQPFLVGTDRENPNRLEDDVVNRKGQRLERHLAGFDLRKIENVVDDGQQRFGR